jgi:DNA polymerase-3 subunit gamma/tau
VAEEKQHQALYRRYRPQGPKDVLGQDHVVRALTGSIADGRLAHAFLFCGPRGTGKTSTARILAKMVNCENGPTADPCGVCEQCVAIRDGHHLDVMEIDAASHGGVEDARELREKAPTAAALGREKVYIIDEAQRLSREAFDALLKVFEEPPPSVRFVLATTEPHKMPATIVGRCQRFDFRRATLETLGENLQRIAKEEGVTLSPGAAGLIARQAEGSFRDSLSLLDQATVVAGDAEIDEAVVTALLGTPRAEAQRELADAISLGESKTVFEVVHRLVQEGQDLRHFTNETLTHFRNLLLTRTAPGQGDLLDVTPDEYEQLRTQAAKFSPAELSRVISLLLEAQADMRWTTSPRLSLELALIRATMPETDSEPQGLVARMERLERIAGVDAPAGPPRTGAAGEDARAEERDPRASAGGDIGDRAEAVGPPPAAPPEGRTSAGPAATATRPARAAKVGTEKEGKEKGEDSVVVLPEAEAVPEVAQARAESGADDESAPAITTSAVDVEMLRRSWPAFIDHLQQHRQPILKALLESATPVTYDGDELELAFPPDRTFGVTKVEERAPELRAALEAVFGVSPQVRCIVRDAGSRTSEPEPEIDDEPAPSEEEALRRIQQELGAQIASRPDGEG